MCPVVLDLDSSQFYLARRQFHIDMSISTTMFPFQAIDVESVLTLTPRCLYFGWTSGIYILIESISKFWVMEKIYFFIMYVTCIL